MKQTEDTFTAELPLTRRGRPPVGQVAMTPAERQRAYRRRLAEERHEVKPAEVSRVTLIRQLTDAFGQLDKPDGDADMNEGAQYMAERIIAELVTRYDLNLSNIRRKSKPVKPSV